MPPHSVDAVRAVLADRSGELALDFVNTRLFERAGPRDAFSTPEGVALWMEEAGVAGARALLPGSFPGRRTLLQESLRLREAVEQALTALSGDRAPAAAAWSVLNRALTFSRLVPELRTEAGEPLLSERYEPGHAAAVLTPLAVSASRFLVEADRRRLRACASERCGRWFYDTSKAGRRRWCSMETCGNRAKAARHRRRHGASATGVDEDRSRH